MLSLTLNRILTHQQHKLKLSLYEVINFRMLWSCEEVLRMIKLHYIRMRYQFGLHQGNASKYGSILNKYQNDYFDGSLEFPSERFLRVRTSEWLRLLSYHDSWKVNLLALEVCRLCGAHYNGLLGSFKRHFWRLWRTSWSIPNMQHTVLDLRVKNLCFSFNLFCESDPLLYCAFKAFSNLK